MVFYQKIKNRDEIKPKSLRRFKFEDYMDMWLLLFLDYRPECQDSNPITSSNDPQKIHRTSDSHQHCPNFQ